MTRSGKRARARKLQRTIRNLSREPRWPRHHVMSVIGAARAHVPYDPEAQIKAMDARLARSGMVRIAT